MKERKISSLYDLKPGDHIQTPCQLQEKKKQLNVYHHLLVVRVVSDTELQVIHNDGTVVVEETKTFSPGEIIVLDYPCAYTAKQAIQRAQSQVGKEWKLLTDNCEHLVTWAKQGKGKSTQVSKGVGVGAIGIAGGASVGMAVGSVVPGIGTVVGGVIGGVVGGVGGVYLYLS